MVPTALVNNVTEMKCLIDDEVKIKQDHKNKLYWYSRKKLYCSLGGAGILDNICSRPCC